MEGLPMLPGNSFRDVTKTNFHVSQTLGWKNGFRTPKSYPSVGIGGDPLKVNQLTESELDELANWQPTLTYGQSRQAPPAAFIPGHVAFDKKVLRFFGYYKETVQESPLEHYRVHHVKLYYYLEDDSIQITESPRNNSGIPQGTILRRQRIPKNEVGDHYTWKDLNNGISMCVYGKVYRWTSCDKFTRDYLESEGIVVNVPEEIPEDPYLAERAHREALKTYKTPSSFDARKQFLEMDKKILRFYAVWDDRDEMFGECRNFIIHYYLSNDTMEIKEVHDTNDGRDPFPVLIRRDRIPKNRDDVSPTFPNVVLELTPNEIKEYFSPKDLKIGQTINVLGRRFLLYDCDNFTKAWYYQHFGVTDFTPIKIDHRIPEIPKLFDEFHINQEMPPYNGFGTLEDSLENSLTFMPQPPKKDFIKQVDNENKVLRYECKMESIRPEDKERRFILSYRLADDMISIYEVPQRNSGFLGGSFLKRTRVAKPGCTADNPEYYGPLDFCVGAIIEVFGTRFIITTADAYVLSFMQANQHYFPREMINNLTTHLIAEEQMRPHKEVIKGGRVTICRKDGDIFQMMKELRTQLKRMAITDKARIDEMFLRYNKDRTGSVTLENMQDICRKMNLPDDEDILACLLEEYGSNGRMNLEEFRRFFEC